jgi:hypothetical protein
MIGLDAFRRLPRLLRDVARNNSAIAVVEFAAALPFLLITFVSATELTNFAIVRMRIGQVALQVADNASRMGQAQASGNPHVTETDINDLLTGADVQAKNLSLYTRGRVIVSSLEAVANPNNTNKFMIRWQRCRGQKNSSSSYGAQAATNLDGMGPAGQVVTTPADTGVMYVEVFYDYKPLFTSGLVPSSTIHDVAAMIVRDSRDYSGNSGTGVYNAEAATAHTCNLFTAT